MKRFYSPATLLVFAPCVGVPFIEFSQPEGFSQFALAWTFWLAYYLYFSTLHIGLTYTSMFATERGRAWISQARKDGLLSYWRTGGLALAILIYFYVATFHPRSQGAIAVFTGLMFLVLRGIGFAHHAVAQQAGILKSEGLWYKTDSLAFSVVIPWAILCNSYFVASQHPWLNDFRTAYLPSGTGLVLFYVGLSMLGMLTLMYVRRGLQTLKDRACLLGCLLLWSMHPVTESAAFCLAAIHGAEYTRFFFRTTDLKERRQRLSVKAWSIVAMAVAALLFIWKPSFHIIFPSLGPHDMPWKRAILVFQGCWAMMHIHFDSFLYRKNLLSNGANLLPLQTRPIEIDEVPAAQSRTGT